MTDGDTSPRGLLVDYGGVLTTSVARSFRDFEVDEGLPRGTVFELIAEAYVEAGGESPIVGMETGAVSVDEFGRLLAARLRDRGHDVAAEGVAARLFAGTRRDPRMWAVVRRAHDAGVRTALVSNSWGTDGYPLDELDDVFDTLVISGEVGLRKPDPAIYHLAAERLDLDATSCAFIDDLDRNVEVARDLGMFGVHHVDVDRSVAQLERFLELDLR